MNGGDRVGPPAKEGLAMSHIGVLSIIGLIVIMMALFVWIFMTLRASAKPALGDRSGEKLKRGPVSGGVIHGDPGQSILTGEAPRQDEREHPDKN
jgi:hypothetical protein